MNGRVPIDHAAISDLCRHWRVTELSLFGSALREDFRPDSDIDVLVTFAADAPWSLLDLVTMREHLRQILGREVQQERLWVVATVQVEDLIPKLRLLVPPVPPSGGT